MNFRLQTPAQLGGYLRAQRQHQKLSQRAVGQRLGVSQSRIARIESDPAGVSFDQLLDLLHVLGTRMVLEADDRAQDVATGISPTTGNADLGPAGSPVDEPW
ncbi:helix-turn-helix domain-containing protein [Roseateles sp. MS654]|uniref:helix-turn-helix domain-containing protein n=1 Tax=Roseateles sp. MS654 TaxID=3412685 RepID=UPI003C2D3DD4